MQNKQHEYILKAFIESRIPRLIYEHLPDMMTTFENIDGYAMYVLKGKKIEKPNFELLTKEEKRAISILINNPDININKRTELLIYYRLAILVEGILNNYYVKNES